MMEGTEKKTYYIVDFFKTLQNPRKIPLLLYLVVDFIFLFWGIQILLDFCSTSLSTEMVLFLSLLGYLVVISLALSPYGEVLFRLINKCQPIEDPVIQERVYPLFQEVYERARMIQPEISNQVTLFIQQNEAVNAFATGRSSICITSGLLGCPDDVIKGVLAHVFGHLAHKDIDVIVLLNVANWMLNIALSMIWLMLLFFKVLLKLFGWLSWREGKMSYTSARLLPGLIGFIQFLLIKVFRNLWNVIGNLLIRFSDRDAEYRADQFASDLGYGEALMQLFRTFPDATQGSTTPLLQLFEKITSIGDSHPATWKRIERLLKKQSEAVSV